MTVSGTVEESIIFGEHIRLIREIRSTLGSNSLNIHDRFENFGFSPLRRSCCSITSTSASHCSCANRRSRSRLDSVTPREAETTMKGYDSWQAPDPGTFGTRLFAFRFADG